MRQFDLDEPKATTHKNISSTWAMLPRECFVQGYKYTIEKYTGTQERYERYKFTMKLTPVQEGFNIEHNFFDLELESIVNAAQSLKKKLILAQREAALESGPVEIQVKNQRGY